MTIDQLLNVLTNAKNDLGGDVDVVLVDQDHEFDNFYTIGDVIVRSYKSYHKGPIGLDPSTATKVYLTMM